MPGPWPDLYSLHSLAKDIKSVLFSYYNILQIISLNHFVQRKPLMSKEWSNGRMYIAHGNDHLCKKKLQANLSEYCNPLHYTASAKGTNWKFTNAYKTCSYAIFDITFKFNKTSRRF